MKRLLLVAFMAFISITSFAQDAPTDERYTYCQIVGTSKILSTKLNIELDYGQRTKLWSDTRMRNPETGEVLEFNSMIDALNFMGKQGWEFVQAYAFTVGNQNVYHYMLKMPFDKLNPEQQAQFVKGE